MRNKLDLILRGGRVKRYHTMDTLTTQSVAEHSFGVAWLAWVLCDGAPSAALLMHALAHDMAEHVTGDLPAPAKRALNISAQFAAYELDIVANAGLLLPDLTGAEQRVLKFADTCELLLYCVREISMGNRGMRAVYLRGMSYIAELLPMSAVECRLINYVEKEFDHAESK